MRSNKERTIASPFRGADSGTPARLCGNSEWGGNLSLNNTLTMAKRVQLNVRSIIYTEITTA